MDGIEKGDLLDSMGGFFCVSIQIVIITRSGRWMLSRNCSARNSAMNNS